MTTFKLSASQQATYDKGAAKYIAPTATVAPKTTTPKISSGSSTFSLTPTQQATYDKGATTFSPTVLSSNKTSDITGIKTKQTVLDNSGVTSTVGADGNPVSTYANGSVSTPPTVYNGQLTDYGKSIGATLPEPLKPADDGTTPTGGYYGNVYVAPGGVVPKDANGKPVALTATNPADDEFKNTLNSLKERADAIGADTLTNIENSYNNLISQQEQANKAAQAGTSAYMVGAGRGVVSSDNVMLQQVSYGLQQVGILQTQKQDAITKARQAILDGDYKYASELHTLADNIATKQQTEYDKIQTRLNEANQKILDDQKQATKDQAIADIYSKGITDVPSILAELKKQGVIDVTSKEVAGTLSNIAKNFGTDTTGLDDITTAFYKLKAQKNGLPASILALPDVASQLAAFTKMYVAAKSVKTSTGSGTGGGGGGGGGIKPISITGQAYADGIRSGNITSIASVPKEYKDEVARDLANNPIFSPLADSRFTLAANRIAKNFIDLPQYKLTANGLPYLQRIQAADSIPGSVSDAELLDSIVKLNTGGNQVTEAQVKLITGGRSLSDSMNVWKNKLINGGVLSDTQRKQLTQLATKVFDRYKKDYQPVYDQVTNQLKAAGIPETFWTIPDLNKLSSGELENPVTGDTHNGITLPVGDETPSSNYQGITLPN